MTVGALVEEQHGALLNGLLLALLLADVVQLTPGGTRANTSLLTSRSCSTAPACANNWAARKVKRSARPGPAPTSATRPISGLPHGSRQVALLQLGNAYAMAPVSERLLRLPLLRKLRKDGAQQGGDLGLLHIVSE